MRRGRVCRVETLERRDLLAAASIWRMRSFGRIAPQGQDAHRGELEDWNLTRWDAYFRELAG